MNIIIFYKILYSFMHDIIQILYINKYTNELYHSILFIPHNVIYTI